MNSECRFIASWANEWLGISILIMIIFCCTSFSYAYVLSVIAITNNWSVSYHITVRSYNYKLRNIF